jgi:hypothetical protein
MADNASYFNDLATPFLITNPGAVTLAATNKALYPVGNIKAMGKDYWFVGKRVSIEIWGQITTAATPGNLTLALFYGTGADANGTSLCASAAQTLVASQTNIIWRARFEVYCTALGSSGALFAKGYAQFGTAVIAVGTFLLPASAPATTTVDLTTASNVLSVQALRSGSTAETMQVVDLIVTPRN